MLAATHIPIGQNGGPSASHQDRSFVSLTLAVYNFILGDYRPDAHQKAAAG
jgi:hypothetical protein